MLAVCKHELRMYFQTLTAYVFGAFLLLAPVAAAVPPSPENPTAADFSYRKG